MNFAGYATVIEEAFRFYAEREMLFPWNIGCARGWERFTSRQRDQGRTCLCRGKVNGNFSQNSSRYGLPTIQGVIVLSDGTNGYPLALMDSTEITMNRTGAATAVAAKYLAKSDSKVATICGCGKQGRIQLIALKHVLPLQNIFAFDTDDRAAERFADEMKQEVQLPIQVISIPLTGASERRDRHCTTSRKFFLRKRRCSKGTFVAAVETDSHDKQNSTGTSFRGKVVADIVSQSATIGDFHHAIQAGFMKQEDAYGGVSEIVAGKNQGEVQTKKLLSSIPPAPLSRMSLPPREFMKKHAAETSALGQI
jgi:ornithine cyclodeaminase/alanine dehydrogenase-like protein (mu-crystallin family)